VHAASTASLVAPDGGGLCQRTVYRENDTGQIVEKIGEPWRNQTSNLLIKSRVPVKTNKHQPRRTVTKDARESDDGRFRCFEAREGVLAPTWHQRGETFAGFSIVLQGSDVATPNMVNGVGYTY
jgi:hypothetical protein